MSITSGWLLTNHRNFSHPLIYSSHFDESNIAESVFASHSGFLKGFQGGA